jgi:hypothetical protein
VNLNGQAFRNARILPAYLDARLAELRWAVVAQELKLKEREEQRQIQERIREEEKARREYEGAMQEAAREEAAIKQAMEKARAEAEHATAQERAGNMRLNWPNSVSVSPRRKQKANGLFPWRNRPAQGTSISSQMSAHSGMMWSRLG